MGVRRRQRRRRMVAVGAIAHHEGVKRGEAEAGYADQGGAAEGYAEPAPAPTDYSPPPADPAGEIEHLAAASTDGPWGDCCELQSWWVAPELRRGGLGLRLLTEAEHEARACGCGQIVIIVHDFQPLALYRRFGLGELARVGDFPEGSSAIWMRKEIEGSAPRDL